jgi:glycine dehydrogenase
MAFVLDDQLDIPYSRKEAYTPDDKADANIKYWPPVGRIDNVFGDKNLICSCPSMSVYETEGD